MIKHIIASCFLLSVYSTHAFAAGGAEKASSHHGDGHHEASAGLPQLDPSSFPSQTFWLVAVFAFMYFFFSRKSLPEIGRIIETRAERIKNDLSSAERLKEEVDAVHEAYENSLKSAREESAALFISIEDDIKKRSEAHAAEFQEQSAKKISALEKKIDKARSKAMEEMSEVAAGIAAEAAEKIIGVRADEDSAIKVVKSLNKAA